MSTAYALAFVVGLFSALHCVGMCGGIMGALSFSLPARARAGWSGQLPFLVAYNAGRVASYAVAGAVFGAFGAAVADAGAEAVRVQDLLRWLAAAVMVGIGLYIGGWFPRFVWIERIGEPVWRRIEPLGRRLMPVTTIGRAVLYGAIWGWLPCGLVYTMLIGAPAQAGPLAGALYMALFGAGTLPVMIAAGLFAWRLYRFAADRRAQAVAGALIIALALFTLILEG